MSDIWPVKVNLDIKANLTKPAEDITEMAKGTHKGFGKILYAAYGPWVEKRLGEAKRIEAQAERDAVEIKNGISKYDVAEKSMISLPEVSSIDALCVELESVNSTLKAKRLAAALMTASIEMKQVHEEEVSDEPLNQTFFNHWRAEAELIDDENLRQWWAHLLVEETKKPNSISPRTLDVAKNLSRKEVEIFIKNMAYVYAGGIIQNENRQTPVSDFTEIISLQEAGLVMPTEFATRHLDLSCNLPDAGKHIAMVFPDSHLAILFTIEKISFSCYVLTTTGNELYKMFKKVESLEEVKAIAQEVSKQNNNAKYKIYPISYSAKNGDGTMTYQFSLTPVEGSATSMEDSK